MMRARHDTHNPHRATPPAEPTGRLGAIGLADETLTEGVKPFTVR
jgi:hypothetical protein